MTFTELETKLTNNCAKVSLWMAQNKLKLNASKTHVMAIGTSRRLQQQEGEIKVTMDGLDLIESETKAEVLLGCSVQSNLKWNSQVEAVQQKLKTRIGALEHLRYVLPYTFRKSIVNAIFNSVLSYCLPLFGSRSVTEKNSLQTSQNKAAWIALNQPSCSQRNQMFDVCKMAYSPTTSGLLFTS